MADVRIEPPKTAELLFNDASKTISDLKSREWQATTLAVAGIVGLYSLNHPAVNNGKNPSHCALIVFMALVTFAHLAVIVRCTTNLKKFRNRLIEIVEKKFDSGTTNDLLKGKFEDAVVDEGTIMWIALGSVWLAFVFATLDILGKL
jgi:hypothetical protein